MCVFFFKQKTAYEMRISDWSSDVCSSDLDVLAAALAARRQRLGQVQRGREAVDAGADDDNAAAVGKRHGGLLQERRFGSSLRRAMRSRRTIGEIDRSEEHTSELQSLMRISYAVFCLKKKQNNQ